MRATDRKEKEGSKDCTLVQLEKKTHTTETQGNSEILGLGCKNSCTYRKNHLNRRVQVTC